MPKLTPPPASVIGRLKLYNSLWTSITPDWFWKLTVMEPVPVPLGFAERAAVVKNLEVVAKPLVQVQVALHLP